MAKNKLPVSMDNMASPVVDKERERKYRAEDALRTCEQYNKIKGDKDLMKDVKKLAKERMKDLQKVGNA